MILHRLQSLVKYSFKNSYCFFIDFHGYFFDFSMILHRLQKNCLLEQSICGLYNSYRSYRIGRAGGSLRGLTPHIYMYIYIYKNVLRLVVSRLAFLSIPQVPQFVTIPPVSLLKVASGCWEFFTSNFLG